MKEIVDILIKKREQMGLDISEVANDLDYTEDELAALEEANTDFFEDVFHIKDILINYSKYLGLDQEKIIDEYNEYLFDFTSKISIKDIKKENKKINKKEKSTEKKIMSPYTKKYMKHGRKIIFALLLLLFLVILFLIIKGLS